MIVNIVLTKTKANKNLSNTAVIAKSKKYTNYLWKLVQVNEKKMAKFKRTSDIKKIEKNNKMILDLMAGKNNLAKKEKLAMLIEEKEEALKKRCQESRKYVSSEKMDTNVNDITKLASDIQPKKST